MSDRVVELVLKLRDEASKRLAGLKGKLGGLASAAGRAVAAGLAVAAAAAAAASVAMLKFGSDAVEAENVTRLAFKDMAGEAEAWSHRFSDATGISRYETISMVSDMGLLVSGMGFGSKAALDMSGRMVQLAGDMSSAKNVPLAEALEKIRAGLVGEAEPLRTMGVLLSAARVEQEAYASGIAKTGEKLTEQQKVQARMNIILQDSVAMHGDLINTQESAANQVRNFMGTIKDAGTAIGVAFQPALEAVLSIGNKMADDLLEWADRTAVFVNAWMKDGGVDRIETTIRDMGEALKDAWPYAQKLYEWLKWTTELSLTPLTTILRFGRNLVNTVTETGTAYERWQVQSGLVNIRSTQLNVGLVTLHGTVDRLRGSVSGGGTAAGGPGLVQAFEQITAAHQLESEMVERLDWRYKGLAGTVEGMAPRVRLTADMVRNLGNQFKVYGVEATEAATQLTGVMVDKLGGAITDTGSKWGQWKGIATGAISAVASQVGGLAGQLMNIGQQLLSGNWVGAILGGVGLLVGKIKGLFGGGTNEWEDAYHNIRQEAESTLASVGTFQESVADQVAQGQARNIATVKAAFEHYAVAAGASLSEAWRYHDQLLEATRTGNERMAQEAIDMYNTWKAQSATAGESMTADFDTFFQGVTAERAPKLTQALIDVFEKGIDAAQRFAQATTAAFDSIPKTITTTHVIETVHVGAPFGGGAIGYTPSVPGGASTPRDRTIPVPQPVLLVDDVTEAVIRRQPRIVDFHGA